MIMESETGGGSAFALSGSLDFCQDMRTSLSSRAKQADVLSVFFTGHAECAENPSRTKAKSFRRIFFLIPFVLLLLFFPSLTAHASFVATVNVKAVPTSGTGVQYRVYARTADGRNVWVYTSKETAGTGYAPVSAVLSGEYVYILDSSGTDGKTRFLKYQKDTGQREKSRTILYVSGASKLLAISSGDLIAAGHRGSLARISPKGKVLWHVDQAGTGVIKMDILGEESEISVWYESGDRSFCTYSIEDGHQTG